MQIVGIDGLTNEQIKQELDHGGKFVIYFYCISIIVMTFKRPSSIYFIRSNQSSLVKGLPFTFMTLFLGWWGIPWGPIYSISSLATNIAGGKDVTADIAASL